MTNEQVIEKLIEQINNNMQIFLGILGLLIALFAYFQWRISQSQINTLKIQIEKDLITKYRLQDIKRELDQTIINDAIRYENVINSEIAKLEDGLYSEGYSVQMEYSERKIVIDMASVFNSAIDDEIKNEIYNRICSRIERLSNMVKNQKDNDKWAYLFSQLLNGLFNLKEE